MERYNLTKSQRHAKNAYYFLLVNLNYVTFFITCQIDLQLKWTKSIDGQSKWSKFSQIGHIDLGSNHGKIDHKVHPPKSKFLIWHVFNINIRK